MKTKEEGEGGRLDYEKFDKAFPNDNDPIYKPSDYCASDTDLSGLAKVNRPSFLPGLISDQFVDGVRDPSLNFLSKSTGQFYYPYCLVSYRYAKTKKTSIIDKKHKDKNAHVLGDSGGFRLTVMYGSQS